MLGGDYGDEFSLFKATVKTVAFVFGELDRAISDSKKRVIFAFFDVLSRVNPSAALAHDNHAFFDYLAVVDFYPEALGIGISAQTGRATGFFV